MVVKPFVQPESHTQTTSKTDIIPSFRPSIPTAELPDSVSRYVGDTLIATVKSPSGPVGVTVAPCCPQVATFHPTIMSHLFFGFDPVTNLVENETDAYWIPPDKTKTLPANKEERDGAVWVSVGVGKEAQIIINFGDANTSACVANCTVEIDPPEIAQVVTETGNVTETPAGSGEEEPGYYMKIKGLSEGEASLKVMCSGKLIGYFHIWCREPVTLKLDICTIKTGLVDANSDFAVGAVQGQMEDIFKQAVFDISCKNLGLVDLSDDETLAEAENEAFRIQTESIENWIKTKDPDQDIIFMSDLSTGLRPKLHRAADAKLQDHQNTRYPEVDVSDLGFESLEEYRRYSEHNELPERMNLQPRPDAYRLYRYIFPRELPSGYKGSNPGAQYMSGTKVMFVYIPNNLETGEDIGSSSAHELGHALGLNHPSDYAFPPCKEDWSAEDCKKAHDDQWRKNIEAHGKQFPRFHIESLNQAVPNIDGPYSFPAHSNIMRVDPHNLMGYLPAEYGRDELRYNQWKAMPRVFQVE